MFTKLTNMMGKTKDSLYRVKLHAQNFILSHSDDTMLKTMPDINQSATEVLFDILALYKSDYYYYYYASVYRHHELGTW